VRDSFGKRPAATGLKCQRILRIGKACYRSYLIWRHGGERGRGGVLDEVWAGAMPCENKVVGGLY